MSLVYVAFDVSLALSVFSFGLQAQRLEDVRFMLRHQQLLFLSLLAMYVVTPFLALLIAEYFDMPATAKIAVVAISLSMIPPLLPRKEIGAGGHGSYGIGLVICVAVLAPVGIPFLVNFLGRVTNRPYGVSSTKIGVTVLGLVIIPLVAGVLFGWLWPRAAKPIQSHAPQIAGYVTLVACIILFVAVAPQIWDFLTGPGGGWVVLAAVVFNFGALAIGHLMGGPEHDHSIVLAVSCACRHPALAFTIANANYPDKDVAAAVIIVLLVNGIVYPAYLKWQRPRVAEAVPEPEPEPVPPRPVPS